MPFSSSDIETLTLAASDANIGDVDVRQVSGAVDSVIVNDVLVSLGVNQVSGSVYSTSAQQSGEWRMDQVSGANFSVSIVDTPVGEDLMLFAISDGVTTVAVQSSSQALKVSVDNATNFGVANSSTLRTVQATDAVSSVVSIANSGVDIGDVDILSIAAGDNNIGNVDIVTVPTIETKQVSGANDSVNVIGTVAVSATDLDVRDLANATDSISAYQSSGSSWSVNTGTVTVTATDLDVRDLLNATDSISVYQSSGAVWSVSVNDSFRTTVASNLINADDRLRVSLETGGSGLTDTELRASSVPISQVSGAIWSVSVNDVFRTTVVSNLINADDRLRVSVETGGGGLTDAELRASSVPISQVSGANWSVNVSGFSATVNVTGSVAADVADDGESPVKIGGIARTTNPTKVADGDRVSMTLDSCGRQVVWPYQVRDLLQTAYVTLSNGTQQVLLAGSAGVFHDLISVSVTNSSTVADTAVSTFAIVDLRSATNGGIVQTLVVKNGRTVIFQPPVPIKQDVAADAWMADMNDINMVGGLITVSALFIKNI